MPSAGLPDILLPALEAEIICLSAPPRPEEVGDELTARRLAYAAACRTLDAVAVRHLRQVAQNQASLQQEKRRLAEISRSS